MRVTFKDVLNRAYTTLFTDYKLDNLIKIDEQAFYTFLSGFLVNSIDMFDNCLTDLSYHEETETDEETAHKCLKIAEKVYTEVSRVRDTNVCSKKDSQEILQAALDRMSGKV